MKQGRNGAVSWGPCHRSLKRRADGSPGGVSRNAATPSPTWKSGSSLRPSFPSGDLYKGPSKGTLLTTWPKGALFRYSLLGDLGLSSLSMSRSSTAGTTPSWGLRHHTCKQTILIPDGFLGMQRSRETRRPPCTSEAHSPMRNSQVFVWHHSCAQTGARTRGGGPRPSKDKSELLTVWWMWPGTH